MNTITVTTKENLQKAKNEEYDVIYVEGKLAEDLKKISVIQELSPSTIATLAATIAPMPIPVADATPIWFSIGICDKDIIKTAAEIGVGLVVALYRDYIVEFSVTEKGLGAKFTNKSVLISLGLT